MKNKLLLILVIILLPIVLFINKKEVKQEPPIEETKEVVVNLKYKDNIINLKVDDYLFGVVASEMPASFNLEALKAQAIASRTFAYNFLKDNVIDIDTNAQNYINNEELKNKWQDKYDKYKNIINEAILSTKDLVIKYNGNIIKSYYFSMSNGKTAKSLSVFNEELPYLEIVDSPLEKDLPSYEVEVSFNKQNFCNILNIKPCNINVQRQIRDESNRIEKIIISNNTYSGIEIRKLLNLRSTDFNISLEDNQVIIKTKGYGHGVGMSQYGANELAKTGYSYEQILLYYYKDVNIEKF